MKQKEQQQQQQQQAGGSMDPRFAKMHSDPRFQRFPKKKGKVEIDSRFAGGLQALPAVRGVAAVARGVAAAAQVVKGCCSLALACSVAGYQHTHTTSRSMYALTSSQASRWQAQPTC
jgi:hypothetical protein